MFSMIVAALNDLPEPQRALRAGADLARSCNAELAAVCILGDLPAYAFFSVVVDPGAPAAMMEERRHRHEELHEKAANLARELGVHAQGSIVVGNEVHAVLRFPRDRTRICSSLDCTNTTSTCPAFGALSMTSLRAPRAAYWDCTE
jgi:nucleotide-binding universal stress UspA family protein